MAASKLTGAANLMTHNNIDAVAFAKEFLVLVGYGVGIAPVFVLHGLKVGLRLTAVAKLGVLGGFGGPHLIGLVLAPVVTKLGAEGPTLERFPVQAGVVVLTETVLHFVGVVDPIQWAVDGVRCILLIIIRAASEGAYGSEGYRFGHRTVGCVALVGVRTARETLYLLVGQAGLEVECEPFVQFGAELEVDVVLVVARAQHDALLLIVGVGEVVLYVLGATADAGVVGNLVTCATKNFVLIVSSLTRFPDLQILPLAVARGS